MGNELISRKNFFSAFKKNNLKVNATDQNSGNSEDPLFKKYSRKSLGERHYSTQLTNVNRDNLASVERVGNVTSGIAPYTGAWTFWEVNHLLRRTHFGNEYSKAQQLLQMTPSQAVDSLFIFPTTPSQPSPHPLNYYQSLVQDSSNVAYGEPWHNNQLTYAGNNDTTIEYYRSYSLGSWTFGVFFNDAIHIREKMTQFWFHFIPVEFQSILNQEGNAAIMCKKYHDLIRQSCLGNFKTLIKEISKTPAMLTYLSNQYSTAVSPNENFARELFELFTIGKQPQNYNEDDIKAASKVFSGWRFSSSYSTTPITTAFDPNYHNQTNKTFSSFFGNTTINNQTGSAGANEFDQFFDMLFTHQANTIAKYVCERLYRFFVYYDIDNNVRTNVITPLANLFIANNWNIEPVIKTLLKSEHFFDIANRGVMIKPPIDYMSALVRNFKVNLTPNPGPTQLLNQYELWFWFFYTSGALLEQSLWGPPTVAGWKAYYQLPTFYQNWITSNTLRYRSEYLDAFINNWVIGGVTLKIEYINYVQQFGNTIVENPDALVNKVIENLLPVDLPQDYKNTLKINTLLSGQTANYYWTDAWNQYLSNPSNTTYTNTVNTRLRSLVNSILRLAEYQLM